MQPSNKAGNKIWRPSQARKPRAESGLLSPPVRSPTSILRAIRLATGSLLIPFGIFIFWRLWRDPKETHLHGPLLVLAGAVILLLAIAIMSKRIRRPRRDDQSVLKL
jgi:hypothetical protein